MNGKRPRWESELFAPQHINPVACETCKFRASIAGDGSQLDRATTGICEIYEYPDSKPNEIYYDGAECEFYEKADDRPLALILGVAVGDALGVPVEFKARGTFHVTGMQGYGTHNQPAGTWSDDTSLTLALADNLLAGGDKPDLESIAWGFTEWYDTAAYTPHGKVFDIGNATAKAIKRLKDGVDPEKAGGAGERDNGNGSLMRIAPLAFTDATDNEIREVSAITHAHRTSTDACIIFVELMRNVMNGALPSRALHLKGVPEQEIRSGGFVRDTLKAATWCFVNTTSYEDCVLVAVNLGDDTDTTAAVAGALAGTVYGIDAIPQEWTDALRGKELIEQCLF